MSNELVKLTNEEAAALAELAGDTGFGDVGPSNGLAFISLLQKNSDLVKNEREGAKPGRFYNTRSDAFTDSVSAIIVASESVFVEREKYEPGQKKKPVAIYQPDDEFIVSLIKSQGGKSYKLENPDNGNKISQQANLFLGLLSDDGTDAIGVGVLPVRSFSLGRLERAITNMRSTSGGSKRPVRAYKLRITSETNAKDAEKNKVLVFGAFSAEGLLASAMVYEGSGIDPLFVHATMLRKQVIDGQIKASYEEEGDPEGDPEADEGPAPTAAKSGVPF